MSSPYWKYLLVLLFGLHQSAIADDTNDGSSWARDAVFNSQSAFSSMVSLGFFDAKITTRNTGSVREDGRYSGKFDAQFSSAVASDFKAIVRAATTYTDRLETDSLDTQRELSEKTLQHTAGFLGGMKLQSGLEVYAGGDFIYLPAYHRKLTLLDTNWTMDYSTVFLVAPQAVLLKRGGNWAAGIFLRLSADKHREIKIHSELEQTTERTHAFSPGKYAGVARLAPTSLFELDLTLAMVLTGDNSEKGSNGTDVGRHSYELSATTHWPRAESSQFVVGIQHRTLSYADQAYMTWENLPQTRLNFQYNLPLFGARSHAGFDILYSSDTQSLRDVNAEYRLLQTIFRAGAIWSL